MGRRDVPLDEVGRAQAVALRAALQALEPSLVVSSPLARARQTMEGFEGLVIDERLVEVHHGEIEGLQELDFRDRYAGFLEAWRRDPEHTAIPGGESLGEALDRCYPALLEHAVTAPAGAPVAICSHQLVIAALLCRCQGLPLGRYRDFTCRNTAINVLAFSEGSWRLLLSDDLSHLDGA